MSKAVQGERGGYLVTSGKPRIATLGGRTYVVGRGHSRACADMREAQQELAAQLAAEREAGAARRDHAKRVDAAEAAASIGSQGLEVGQDVWFRIEPGAEPVVGTIAEIGARSVAINYGRDTYRRAPGDVARVE